MSAPRRPWRKVRRGLVLSLFAPLVLAAAGAVFEVAAEFHDAYRYPPPGTLFDVGGYRLHLHCVGEGGPTVILEAGKGGYSLDWALVQPEVGRFTRVCAYDRAGHAWSDARPEPRDLRQLANELQTLLRKAEVPGPYVLVGHSYGGLIVQRYAQEYKDSVAGMVLVDSVTERGLGVPLEEAPRVARSAFTWPDTQAVRRRLGILRLWKWWKGRAALDPPFDRLPSPAWEARLAFTIHPRALREQAGEGVPEAVVREQALAAQAALRSALGEQLLLVISSDPVLRAGGESDVLSAAEVARTIQQLREEQAALAGLASRSDLLVATGSGHFVHLERPETVVGAIQRVVQSARASRP